jgi:hypothetical protein
MAGQRQLAKRSAIAKRQNLIVFLCNKCEDRKTERRSHREVLLRWNGLALCNVVFNPVAGVIHERETARLVKMSRGN